MTDPSMLAAPGLCATRDLDSPEDVSVILPQGSQ
jgi:hypothetical protein